MGFELRTWNQVHATAGFCSDCATMHPYRCIETLNLRATPVSTTKAVQRPISALNKQLYERILQVDFRYFDRETITAYETTKITR